MKTKYGNWSYRQKRGNNIYEHQIIANNRIVIAELDGKDFEIKGSDDLEKSLEIKANAKLIAAAPELLNSLNEMIELFQRIHGNAVIGRPTINKAKEIIRKATE